MCWAKDGGRLIGISIGAGWVAHRNPIGETSPGRRVRSVCGTVGNFVCGRA